MVAVLAAASYYRIGFSPCLAVRVRGVRVPGGSVFHLEPGTIRVKLDLFEETNTFSYLRHTVNFKNFSRCLSRSEECGNKDDED